MLKYQGVLVEQGHVKHILAVFGDYFACLECSRLPASFQLTFNMWKPVGCVGHCRTLFTPHPNFAGDIGNVTMGITCFACPEVTVGPKVELQMVHEVPKRHAAQIFSPQPWWSVSARFWRRLPWAWADGHGQPARYGTNSGKHQEHATWPHWRYGRCQ